jgi:hypothetical protein
MKLKSNLMLAAIAAMAFFSCNDGEGYGGKSTLQGSVYEVFYNDNNYSFKTDTATNGTIGKKVYIESDNGFFDDVDTRHDGSYQFEHLREGTYKVYVVSKDKFGNQTPEIQTVKVGSGTTQAPAIYFNSGDCYNTAMVKGRAWVKYYINGFLATEQIFNPSSILKDSLPAIKGKVYIQNLYDLENGNGQPLDNVTPSDDGTFIFKELKPYNTYVVYMQTETQEKNGQSEYRNIIFSTTPDTVVVGAPYQYYPLAPDTLSITTRVNIKL